MYLQDLDGQPQGQNELTRSQNVLFNKEVDRKVTRFSKKLTRYQAITNTVST
jgi:hypothetical protein